MMIIWMVIGGFVAGLLAALAVARTGMGCALLLLVPVAMIALVLVDQNLHPEDQNSTSALAFIFAPFWPSIGAIGGFLLGKLARRFIFER